MSIDCNVLFECEADIATNWRGAGYQGLTLRSVRHPQERASSAFVTRQENHKQLARPHTQNQLACETRKDALEQQRIWWEKDPVVVP